MIDARVTGWLLLTSTLLMAAPAFAGQTDADKSDTPRELGAVHWRRGFDAAQAAARTEGKPLLILFDEVPGCSNCTGYGDAVLSHPLIVEAIESNFVPVAVYNNVKGDDERVLRAFNEPAWNNPVVRIVAADRAELAPRVNFDSGLSGLSAALVAALDKAKRPVPAYLTLLSEEAAARGRGAQRAVFTMLCFWEGEARLGGLPGVIETRPGFVKGEEAVEVWFDSTRVSYSDLVRAASKMQCAKHVFTQSDDQQSTAAREVGDAAVRCADALRPDQEPKYFLAATPLKYLPMTATQACRVNSAIRENQDPSKYLSPRQVEVLERIKAAPYRDWKLAIGVDLKKAWEAAKRAESKSQ